MKETIQPVFSHIVVIGTSAGGVQALTELVKQLPEDFTAPVFLTHHQMPVAKSMMPEILSRSGPLPARHALNNLPIEAGNIYVAPPDKHMLVKRGRIVLGRGPRENCTRPAIDPLFRTAAKAYGAGVIAIILTGNLDDGTAGLAVVKKYGGVAIVQDPAEALYPSMPESAIENVPVDYVLPVEKIAEQVIRLVNESSGDGKGKKKTASMKNIHEEEPDPAEGVARNLSSREDWGTPSVYTCPDCQGTLWETSGSDDAGDYGKMLRFRCRVGHAFSGASLAAEQSHRIEEALWTALRALEERSSLANKLAERARRQNQSLAEKRFELQKQELEAQAAVIRELLEQGRSEAV